MANIFTCDITINYVLIACVAELDEDVVDAFGEARGRD